MFSDLKTAARLGDKSAQNILKEEKIDWTEDLSKTTSSE
jgi:hypothetical protein